MELDLQKEESIILSIGSIKLSDTGNTFGREKTVNGYEYKPLKNPKNIVEKNIITDVAYGDVKRGTTISDGKDDIILLWGANRDTSPAQSMAIGHFDGLQYIFVVETFRDIYRKDPELATRRIATCKSLWDHSEGIKLILSNGQIAGSPTKKEIQHCNELFTVLEKLAPAFREENISALRLHRDRGTER